MEFPLRGLVSHEVCERDRLAGLVDALRKEPIREPVHVSMGSPPLILDGAHRVRASSTLRRRSVPVHRVDVADSFIAPGWVHSCADVPALELSSGEGPAVAILGVSGGEVPVAAESDSASDIYDAFWRLFTAVSGNLSGRLVEAPAEGPYLRWQMPSWKIIREISVNIGPFPPGVSRFGDLIKNNCSECLAGVPSN